MLKKSYFVICPFHIGDLLIEPVLIDPRGYFGTTELFGDCQKK